MDSSAFTEQVQQCERLLYSIGWSYLSNNEDCLDAVQDTLMKAWRNRDTLKDTKMFRSWLTRIMINTCKDILRRRQKIQWVALEEDTISVPPPEYCGKELHRAMNSLVEDQRIMMILRYQEGYKMKEIADLLSIPLGTVKTRIRKSKINLRHALETQV